MLDALWLDGGRKSSLVWRDMIETRSANLQASVDRVQACRITTREILVDSYSYRRVK